ncbi:hypothetical protein GGI15_004120 [Coemansia interrupta]|uniref:AB hydrolase-1 domain-containing protein n=1 Tax=Coemansia interrupta TaxID=1126814 RepID=A0A9W8LFR3_9FUNG|nr:hypothetical protein GGI15_004120 [Coemansia interrupta]
MAPNMFLTSGKMQTVYSVMLLRKRDKYSNVEYERQEMTMSDGGLVSLDWYPGKPPSDAAEPTEISVRSYSLVNLKAMPIVIVLPGSMGSSVEYHIRCFAKSLCNGGISGCRLVVLNHRGYARTPLRTVRAPAFHYTGDLDEIVQYLSKTFPGSPLGAIGYSMGANILTKYLGEQGKNSKLSAAVTICCPFDVTKLYNSLGQPTFFNNKVLQSNLTAAAARFVRKNYDVLQSGPRRYDLDSLLKARSLIEMDKLLTVPISGFASCEQYFRESSSGPYVHKITTPLLAINSKDDPMVPVDAIPEESFRDNPNTALILTNHGGHLGFFTGTSPRIWYIDPVVQFFSKVLL